MPSKHAKWIPLLGDELARRVVALKVDDPAAFCREAVRVEVEKHERKSSLRPTTAEQAKCPHPESKRNYGRCRACGQRGLPEVAKSGGKT